MGLAIRLPRHRWLKAFEVINAMLAVFSLCGFTVYPLALVVFYVPIRQPVNKSYSAVQTAVSHRL